MLLVLDREQDFFLRNDEGYLPRTRDDLAKLHERRRREAEKARDADDLAKAMSKGKLPERLTGHQEALIEALRGYAVHGEDLPRRQMARDLVERASPGTGDLQRACFELLVRCGVFGPDEPLDLHRAGIRPGFPDEALEEADGIAVAFTPQRRDREDLTGLEAVTIDDEGTMDRDDAVSLEVLESGYRLWVHIADGGALAPAGGAMDREADRRMVSLYLPECSIPMLPDSFTRGVGSLDPGEERLAISLSAELTRDGEVRSWRAARSIIRSAAALSYDEVVESLHSGGRWQEMLEGLHRVAAALARRRSEQGAVNIDQREMTVRVGASGEIVVKVRDRSAPGYEVVSELMILCNALLARFCSAEGLPAVYRSQRRPDLWDAPVLPGLDERAAQALARYNVGRRMEAAQVTTKALPHEGLGVDAYLQATSPLRRYLDLVIQRQIGRFLAEGKPLYTPKEVDSVAQRAQAQLKEMSQVETARRRYWFLKYLSSSRMPPDGPDTFEAVALHNDGRRNALLELLEFPFRARAALPKSVTAGQVVRLRLRGVDLWRKAGHFVHAP